MALSIGLRRPDGAPDPDLDPDAYTAWVAATQRQATIDALHRELDAYLARGDARAEDVRQALAALGVKVKVPAPLAAAYAARRRQHLEARRAALAADLEAIDRELADLAG